MIIRTIIVCSIIYLANALNCHRILGELGDAQSQLMYCITTNSVPVTLCVNCQENHANVSKVYDLLAANCSSEYFNKDRINLVASTQSVLTGLWTKAFCDDCFNNNNSVVFYDKNNTLKDCFNHQNGDPCENCKAEYLDLNNFYINLDQHNNGEVCYDLQDQMNRTRNKWSKELKCCPREKNMTLFVIALCVTSCLPLLFYGSTFLITRRQERYHRVLYDQDPIHSSEVPSSSLPHNMNDINNPTQSMLNNRPPFSNANINDATPSTSFKAPQKGFYLNEDVESSDDEMQINGSSKSKEI